MSNIGRAHITYSPEQLRELSNLSPSEILTWLEEYLEFLEEAMSPEAKGIFEKFRAGKLEYPSS